MPSSKSRLLYLNYFLKNSFFVFRYKLFHIKKSCLRFRGKKGITLEYSNDALKSHIESGKPFAAIRFGAVELGCLNNAKKIELGFKKTYKPLVRYSMKNNAGLFPTDDKTLQEYSDLMFQELPKTDLLGISGVHMEDYFQRLYCPNADYIQYEGMEPLRGDWVKSLKGKRVLVITPFDEDVRSQYQRREKLFLDDPELLPEFTLLTLQAPLTLADEESNLPSSIDVLKHLEEQIKALEFDIALVGAGVYGSPLCLFIKSLGKQAIQTGGATSTLFGIMGRRWESRPHVSKHANEYWIHPSVKPKGYEKVEKGAYW